MARSKSPFPERRTFLAREMDIPTTTELLLGNTTVSDLDRAAVLALLERAHHLQTEEGDNPANDVLGLVCSATALAGGRTTFDVILSSYTGPLLIDAIRNFPVVDFKDVWRMNLLCTAAKLSPYPEAVIPRCGTS
jgi:hypothetical protein